MKAILISIKPKYVADILNGLKTIEIRKSIPKCDLPIDVYIYCCKQQINEIGCHINYEKVDGKVVAKFTLKKVEEVDILNFNTIYKSAVVYCTDSLGQVDLLSKSRLSFNEMFNYVKDKGYAWHIDNLVPFDKPKEISEFNAYCKKSGMECLHCKHYWTDDSAGYSIPKCSGKPLTRAPQSFMFIEV